MNTRKYLLMAQEADAIGYKAEWTWDRCRWEEVAAEYRRLAKTAAMRQQFDSDKSTV